MPGKARLLREDRLLGKGQEWRLPLPTPRCRLFRPGEMAFIRVQSAREDWASPPHPASPSFLFFRTILMTLPRSRLTLLVPLRRSSRPRRT